MDEATTGGELGLSTVGMLGNGAPQSLALEVVAMRKHGGEAWEPFHYEKISETEYEVSGGIPAMVGGVKKWPGPHSSVMVSVDEILREQQENLQENNPADNVQVQPQSQFETLIAPARQLLSDTASARNDPSIEASAAPAYLTVVLQLPSDEQGRKRICNALSLDANFFGAVVTATSLADEIAVNQLLELRCEPADVRDARERVARRNQAV